MHVLLNQVISQQSLSQAQAESFFSDVLQGKVAPELLASMLTALKIKGETSEEIAGAAKATINAALRFPTLNFDVADCVGTGGDGANTINISTTAAILAAACGLKMAKHGNRSVSSLSGSADLLESLGLNLLATPEQAANCLTQTNFCFLYAPAYHSGFKHAAPVRKAMKIRTLFNILGPLVNPAKPKTMVLGVYTPDLLEVMANALMLNGVERALVVHGSGLDEIALHGETQVVEINQGLSQRYTISPEDFGITPAPLADLVGGSPAQNAEIIKAILQGKGQTAHNHAVLINCAALLALHNEQLTLKQAANQAAEVLVSGKAYQTFMHCVELSHQAV